jgi:hypothetical protein
MLSRVAKGLGAAGLVALAGLVFVPLGCGDSHDGLVLSALGQPPGTRRNPDAPEEVQPKLERCVKENSAPLPPAEGATYVIDLDVRVARSGRALSAKVKESMFPGHALEGCFENALREVTWPARALALHAESAPRRSATPPESRAFAGQELVLPNPVSLVPVVIAVAAVVVVVGIVVYVTSETADAPPLVTAIPVASAVPRDLDETRYIKAPVTGKVKLEKWCRAQQLLCLENKDQPLWNQADFGETKDCGACLRECKSRRGWPKYKCPHTHK